MNHARIDLQVPADHPALPGHFPGEPIVPGVVLLGLVHRHAIEHLDFAAGPSQWRRIRFLRPVRPEERVVLDLTGNSDAFSFTIQTPDASPVARGRCLHVALA